MTRDLDVSGLVRTLDEHAVDYILIGGMAAVAQGSPFPTEDVDITPETGADNLARLSSALGALDARVRVAGEPDGVPFPHDAASLARLETVNLTTRFGDLDISLHPSGTGGFPDLARSAKVADIYDVVVRVAALADVIRSKQAANRPKDQRVLPVLRELLEQQSRQSPSRR